MMVGRGSRDEQKERERERERGKRNLLRGIERSLRRGEAW